MPFLQVSDNIYDIGGRIKEESRVQVQNGENEEKQSISDNKQRIYDFIKNNPGTHLRKISKELNIAMGDTQYNLNLLEKSGSIKSRRIGRHRTYYTVSISGERSESILAVLQQETPRDILLYLIENPGATQGDIVRLENFTAPTINEYMCRLIEIGLVRSHKEGRFVKYYLKGDIHDIIVLLKSYHPSIWNKLSNRLAEVFLDLLAASQEENDSIIAENKVWTQKRNDNIADMEI